MDHLLNGMKVDRSVGKEITKMGKKRDYGLLGMKMDTRNGKILIGMG